MTPEKMSIEKQTQQRRRAILALFLLPLFGAVALLPRALLMMRLTAHPTLC